MVLFVASFAPFCTVLREDRATGCVKVRWTGSIVRWYRLPSRDKSYRAASNSPLDWNQLQVLRLFIWSKINIMSHNSGVARFDSSRTGMGILKSHLETRGWGEQSMEHSIMLRSGLVFLPTQGEKRARKASLDLAPKKFPYEG